MANVIDYDRKLRVNVRNQCGPQRTIMAVDNSGPGWTLVTNSCGHVAKHASHFHYKIGTEHSCFDCRFADDNVISQEAL